MTYKDLEAMFGKSPSAIAKALALSPQRVTYWRDIGKIPIGAQAEIQIRTRGRLRAEAMRERA